MNERFRPLADQAQIGIFEDKAFGWSVIAGTDQHLAKFAELIVQECASRVDNILRERKDGGGTMGDEIREHFGVEE